MGGTLRRSVRRALLGASAASLLVSFLAPLSSAQQVDEVPRPEVFRGAASSLAASVQADRDALLPVPELFRFIALDGSGTYESSSQSARASIFFPGNGLILGPALACGTFGGQFPAMFKPILDACMQYKYPLTVFADSFTPDGSTSGSLAFGSPNDAVSGNAVRAHAHADEAASTTDAAMQDFRLLGLPAFGPVTPPIPGFELDTSMLTIDNATSRTNQRIVKGGLVVDAESTLSGVKLIGGLLRIGSIKSESHVTDDAHGKRTADAKLEMSGVTVAGLPAQITDQGLVVGSPTGVNGPLVQQLQAQANAIVSAFNMKVTALPVEKSTDKPGAATASVGGVLIEFSRDAQGLPTVPGPAGELDPNGNYTGSIQLGNTSALGGATSFGDIPIDDTGGGVVSDGGIGLGSSDLGGGSSGVLGESSSTPDAGTPSVPGVTGGKAPVVGSSPSQRLASAVGNVFGNRMGLLYLAVSLAALSLCLVPRLTVPARLPRYRS